MPPRKKKETAVGCLFSNDCKNVHLCCNFCTVKNCVDRCTNDHTKCRFVDLYAKEKTLKISR